MVHQFIKTGISLCAAMLATQQLQAQTIIGPAQITGATSTIANGDPSFPLIEIRDGVTADTGSFNGFQGANNATGTMTFTLDQPYDIDRFHLWNDINVRAEGVANFTLRFFGGSTLLHTQSFSAQPGQVAVQDFLLSTTVRGVDRVEMQVDSLLAQPNTFARRVEIREVAFSGVRTGDGSGSASLDNYVCYDLLAHENSPASVRRGGASARSFLMTDQFGRAQARVGHPVKVCNPVGLNDRETRPYDYHLRYKDHYVCYQLWSEQDGRPGVFNVYVDNALLGASMVSMADRDELCVKSKKLYEDEIGGNGPPPPPPSRRRKN